MATGWVVCRWLGMPTMGFDRGSIWINLAVLPFG
jgi:hypothetical protein